MPFDLTVDVDADFTLFDVDPDDDSKDIVVTRTPSLGDSVRMLLSSIERSVSRRNSVFASDLREAEELLAALESSGARDADAELQPDGQVLVSWRRG